MPVDSKLLELLVCPVSKASLSYRKERGRTLVSSQRSGVSDSRRDSGDARGGSRELTPRSGKA